jgi:rubrerythrin
VSWPQIRTYSDGYVKHPQRQRADRAQADVPHVSLACCSCGHLIDETPVHLAPTRCPVCTAGLYELPHNLPTQEPI